MMFVHGRRVRRAAVLVLPLALLVSSRVSRAQSPDPKLLGYPAAGAPPVLSLVSAGAEPRTALRYVVPKDYKSGMSMNLDMAIGMKMDGTPLPESLLPTMTIGANLSVTDISAAGDITYTTNFTGMKAEVPAGADATALGPTIQAMQGMDADYKSISGVVTVNSRGVNKAAKFDFTKLSNPAVKQILTSASSSLENMSMPLPEEAVGVGARWEVKQTMSANSMQTMQRTTYEMTAFDGKTVTLKMKTEQSAMPQEIKNPDMPGMQMFLRLLSGTGDGTITIRLDSLVPTSDTKANTSATMEVEMAGQKMTMVTDTKVKMVIGPIK